METVETPQYQLTERRIAQLTLLLGAAAAVAGWALYSLRVGAGVLVGAALAWVNFRWLAGALDGLVDASAATGDPAKAQVPLSSIFKMGGRYVLIAAAVYVIFSVFHIPVVSMLVGLCALGAATMVASLGEIVRWTS
jgi:small-conductance mechanosensitive channel